MINSRPRGRPRIFENLVFCLAGGLALLLGYYAVSSYLNSRPGPPAPAPNAVAMPAYKGPPASIPGASQTIYEAPAARIPPVQNTGRTPRRNPSVPTP